MNFLRKTYILLSFLSMTFLAFCFCSPLGLSDNGDDDKFKTIIENVRKTLTYLHYRPQVIDNTFSEKVYATYMEDLDPYKTYFKSSDIAHFDQYKDDLDEFFKDENLDFYHQTIDTLYNRLDELDVLSQKILKQPFEFKSNEEIVLDYNQLSYPKTQKGWEDNWAKHLKYRVLQEISLAQEQQKDSLENKEAVTDKKPKTFARLEEEARKNVADDMSEFFRRFKVRKKSDLLSLYVNSFTTEYDPHTNYYSPKENEDFEMNMSGQLEGIGATLADEKGYPTIKSLIIGGPAWKQGDLEVDDKITKVAQGENGEPVNVVGMLLDDAIRLIRGKKGSIVELTIQKKDGSFKQIQIERDIVELEETFARSAVIKNENGEKYGLIYLPSFYLKYDKNGRDASDDILNEINALKEEGVKGIVFDVRSNGGGDLKEVVEIVGHFIEKGPVVKVLRSDGKENILEDTDETIAWSGPMVVMTNELSASASEIFAAALQDYKRAVIVGSPKTYGKGTVQTISPLNRFLGTNEEYGALKFTIQKFYRVTGGSTQLKGVESDIVLPDPYTYVDYSEASQETALPWDQIAPADYSPWKGKINYSKIKKESEARLADKSQVKLLEENAKWIKHLDDENSIPLNYEKFKTLLDERDKGSEKFDALTDYDNHLTILSPKYEIPLMENDTVILARRKHWHENMTKDIYLEESINVLRDLSAN